MGGNESAPEKKAGADQRDGRQASQQAAQQGSQGSAGDQVFYRVHTSTQPGAPSYPVNDTRTYAQPPSSTPSSSQYATSSRSVSQQSSHTMQAPSTASTSSSPYYAQSSSQYVTSSRPASQQPTTAVQSSSTQSTLQSTTASPYYAQSSSQYTTSQRPASQQSSHTIPPPPSAASSSQYATSSRPAPQQSSHTIPPPASTASSSQYTTSSRPAPQQSSHTIPPPPSAASSSQYTTSPRPVPQQSNHTTPPPPSAASSSQYATSSRPAPQQSNHTIPPPASTASSLQYATSSRPASQQPTTAVQSSSTQSTLQSTTTSPYYAQSSSQYTTSPRPAPQQSNHTIPPPPSAASSSQYTTSPRPAPQQSSHTIPPPSAASSSQYATSSRPASQQPTTAVQSSSTQSTLQSTTTSPYYAQSSSQYTTSPRPAPQQPKQTFPQKMKEKQPADSSVDWWLLAEDESTKKSTIGLKTSPYNQGFETTQITKKEAYDLSIFDDHSKQDISFTQSQFNSINLSSKSMDFFDKQHASNQGFKKATIQKPKDGEHASLPVSANKHTVTSQQQTPAKDREEKKNTQDTKDTHRRKARKKKGDEDPMGDKKQGTSNPIPDPQVQTTEIEVIAASQEEKISGNIIWKLNRPFRNHSDIKTFVRLLNDEKDKESILDEFNQRTKQASENLGIIADAKMTVGKDVSLHSVCFFTVVVPLCAFISDRNVQNSPFKTQVAYLNNVALSDGSFLQKVFEIVSKLNSNENRQQLAGFIDYQRTKANSSFIDIIIPIMEVFVIYMRKITNSSVNEMLTPWCGHIEKFIACNKGGDKLHILLRDIQNLIRIAQPRKVTPKSSEVVKKVDLVGEKSQVVLLDPSEGPGNLRKDGRRHDNDHEDFRQISVMPTHGEMLSKVLDYLPHPNRRDDYYPTEEDIYLDRQFRLMRYDMIASVRKATALFVDNLSNLTSDAKSNHHLSGIVDDEKITLSVFQNANFCKILPQNKKLQCIVSFDHPTNAEKKGITNAKGFWTTMEGSKLLEFGQLAIIIVGIHVTPSNGVTYENIFFANISGDAKINKSDVQVPLDFITWDAIYHYLEYSVHTTEILKKKKSMIAITRNNNVEMYQPILNCLKSMTPMELPFSSILCYENSEEIWHSPLHNSGNSFAVVRSIFLDKNPRNIPLRSFEELRDYLFGLKDIICLDDTQIESYAIGLTRKVGLIQGPPGTGKTYVGLKLILSIIENNQEYLKTRQKSQVSHFESNSWAGWEQTHPSLPILCICYTNHALDQFLEGLVDAGVPLDKVVRIGNRSKSEKLASRTLGSMKSGTQTVQDWKFKKLYRSMKEAEERLLKLIDGMNNVEETLCECLEALEDTTFQSLFPDALIQLVITSKKMESQEKSSETKIPPRAIKIKLLSSWIKGSNLDEAVKQLCTPITLLLSQVKREVNTKLWSSKLLDRQPVTEGWSNLWKRWHEREFRSVFQNYEKSTSEIRNYQARSDLNLVKSSYIIGATTSGCARFHELIRSINPQIVICEEAGEVLESHIISSISHSVKQLIMIGDHLQLRPKVNEYTMSMDNLMGYGLDMSLFERLVRRYEKQRKLDPLDQRVFLTTMDQQRRMTPVVSSLIKNTLYPKLKDSVEVTRHPLVRGMKERLWFLNHSNREDGYHGSGRTTKSASNSGEASMIVEFLKYLVRQGYTSSNIAILTPYLGQLFTIRKLLKSQNIQLYLNDLDRTDLNKYADDENDFSEDSDDEDTDSEDESSDEQKTETKESKVYEDNSGWLQVQKKTKGKKKKKQKENVKVVNQNLQDSVRLATVDNFQGEEAEVVIISTVRNNPGGHVGFLRISNRVNVMLSRAKHGMYILGSVSTIRASKKAVMFNQVIDEMEATKKVGSFIEICCHNHKKVCVITKPQDFSVNAPDGGCNAPCDTKLKCGHRCPRSCHPDDIQHGAIKCKEKCGKTLSCGHPCNKLCCEPCGNCDTLVSFKNKCGHEAKVKCQYLMDGKEVPCFMDVDFEMPYCKHANKMKCKDVQIIKEICENVGDMEIPKFTDQFKESHSLFSCKKECGRIHDKCSHTCRGSCGPCLYKSCSESSTIIPKKDLHVKDCEEKCMKPMICGHSCNEECHKTQECPPCKKSCIPKCEHSKCALPCAFSCDTCSEECDWSCKGGHENQKFCTLLCAMPCERLPCDERCSEILVCGHRCPSLCGEVCPDVQYCHECGSRKGDKVDMIGGQKYGDVDLNETRVLILECGHFFTVDSLDMSLGIMNYYTHDGKTWTGTKEPNANFDHASLQCPDCQAPFRKIKRYGRIVKYFTLLFSQEQYILKESIFTSRLKNERNQKRQRRGKEKAKNKSEKKSETADQDSDEEPNSELASIFEELSRNNGFLLGLEQKSPFNAFLQKYRKKKAASGTHIKPHCIQSIERVFNQVYAERLEYNLRRIMECLDKLATGLKPKAHESGSPQPEAAEKVNLNPDKGKTGKAKDKLGKSKPNVEKDGESASPPPEKILKALDEILQSQFIPASRQFENICTENNLVTRLSMVRVSSTAFMMKLQEMLHEGGQSHPQLLQETKKTAQQVLVIKGDLLQKIASENTALSKEFLASSRVMATKAHSTEPRLYTDQEMFLISKMMDTKFKDNIKSFGGKWIRCANGHIYCIKSNPTKSDRAAVCAECGVHQGEASA